MTALAAFPKPARLADLVAQGLVHLAAVLTNAGVAIITNRLLQAGTAPRYLGWGTGTTTAAVAQTALVAEAAPTTGGGRVLCTESRASLTVANDTYQLVGTITATVPVSVTEIGLFDAASTGNMLFRADSSSVNMAVNDQLQQTIQLRFVAG